ncbi:hypothetical protein ACI3KW_09695 [Devosia sp. ZW T5_3]|uniref:hypothetical protein n=1 Tax=Devosia sp. ZW T5_3 TaxID=3378085 RepID=UPI0038530E10
MRLVLAAAICLSMSATAFAQADSARSELDTVALILAGVTPGELDLGDIVIVTVRTGDGAYEIRKKGADPSLGYKEYWVKKVDHCKYAFASKLRNGEGLSYSTQAGWLDAIAIESMTYETVAGYPYLYSKKIPNLDPANFFGDPLLTAAFSLEDMNRIAAEFLETVC